MSGRRAALRADPDGPHQRQDARADGHQHPRRADLGEPITFWFAVLREVVVKTLLFGIVGIDHVGIASLLDVLWPLWDEENRALHDFIVSTRVVQD